MRRMKTFQIIGREWHGESDTIRGARSIVSRHLENGQRPRIYVSEDVQEIKLPNGMRDRVPTGKPLE